MNILYVYAIAGPAAGFDPAPPPPPGLAGAPVLVLPLDAALSAICSHVPAQVVSDDQLLDPVAAAEAALAHHAVVEWAHAQATIVPFAFGCAFRSEPDLRHTLLADAASWAQRLAFLDGCEEIEVRLQVDLDHLREQALSEMLAAQGPGLSAGRRYLLERAVERDLAAREAEVTEQAWARLASALEERSRAGLLDELRAVSIRPNQARVFLMLKTGQGICKVVEMSSELESGIRFDVSRPWPPYSFSAASSVAASPKARDAAETGPVTTQSFASLGGN